MSQPLAVSVTAQVAIGAKDPGPQREQDPVSLVRPRTVSP